MNKFKILYADKSYDEDVEMFDIAMISLPLTTQKINPQNRKIKYVKYNAKFSNSTPKHIVQIKKEAEIKIYLL